MPVTPETFGSAQGSSQGPAHLAAMVGGSAPGASLGSQGARKCSKSSGLINHVEYPPSVLYPVKEKSVGASPQLDMNWRTVLMR
ncbi:hypothetical protein B9Z55_025973 [Caenorhabditis nigoni]|uniref:Uncharacterized protein n=1 Tax=Caenorhabditis nigoni TaxID=1611254 RepID=A0A2G5T117_9PELO|nr:hypothetical protein B9Z55_025973 [Caenorhabditis nigoni]